MFHEYAKWYIYCKIYIHWRSNKNMTIVCLIKCNTMVFYYLHFLWQIKANNINCYIFHTRNNKFVIAIQGDWWKTSPKVCMKFWYLGYESWSIDIICFQWCDVLAYTNLCVCDQFNILNVTPCILWYIQWVQFSLR